MPSASVKYLELDVILYVRSFSMTLRLSVRPLADSGPEPTAQSQISTKFQQNSTVQLRKLEYIHF